MLLTEVIGAIKPADEEARQACIARFDRIGKPVGSLGKLETLLSDIAAASGSEEIDIGKKCVIVCCADNGVVAQGVAQTDHSVTTVIARSLVRGTSSVSVMAKTVGAQVFPVDVGMIDRVPGMENRSVAAGTRDFTEGPAMTRAQAERAILTGVELVRRRAEEGYRLIATGEAGIGNTTSSSAVLASLLGKPAEAVTGRGSGLSDEGLQRKIRAIARGIEINRPNPEDPVDVLAKVGGFDLCAMTGLFLGGAICHIPVIMDGFISGAAALCAVKLCPAVRGYLLPSHMTAEPAGMAIMEALDCAPVIHGDLRLGEGTGAVALMSLLELGAAVYHHAATFEELQMEAYEKWSST